MTSKVVSHLVGKKLEHAFGAEDPYYLIHEEQDEKGNIKRTKIKKELPKGLSKNDLQILKSVKRRAYYLELVFNLCGFNCGFAAIIGIIPVIGTIINLYFGLQVLGLCAKIDGGLDNWDRSKMMTNILADAGMGLVPVAGDIVAAIYKSNTRNASILERILKKRGEENLKKNGEPPAEQKHSWFALGGANGNSNRVETNPKVTAPPAAHSAPVATGATSHSASSLTTGAAHSTVAATGEHHPIEQKRSWFNRGAAKKANSDGNVSSSTTTAATTASHNTSPPTLSGNTGTSTPPAIHPPNHQHVPPLPPNHPSTPPPLPLNHPN